MINVTFQSRFRNSAALAALLLFWGCASQAPPSGGPPDRTPPRVVSTVPADDSVRVGLEAVIEVAFSEPMDRQSVERTIFLSPRPTVEPRFKWKGRRLQIMPEGGLLAQSTYSVSVGADGRDEYRNKMLRSYDFSFSTGETISTGEVSGRLKETASRAIYVTAYNLGGVADPDPGMRAPFITQAGEGGDFRFSGLDNGTYRVFAFEDADQDQTYDSGIERLAIPIQDALVRAESSSVRLPTSQLAGRDTVGPSPLAVRTVNQRQIRVKMSEPVQLPINVRVLGDEDTLSVSLMHPDVDDSKVVYLVTSRQLEGATYQVVFSELLDVSGNSSARDTTIQIKGAGRLDSRSPQVSRTWPPLGLSVTANASVVLMFNEAMDADSVAAVWVVSDSTASPAGAGEWVAPNVWRFVPDEALSPGDVRLQVRAGAFQDLAGNKAEGPIELSFVVVGQDDLGTLLGQVLSDDAAQRVQASPLFGGETYSIRISSGDTAFVMKGLIPGKYRVEGFVDVDDDGVWFPGTLDPFAHAEPLLEQSDTVEVRSRWETVVETQFSRWDVRTQERDDLELNR